MTAAMTNPEVEDWWWRGIALESFSRCVISDGVTLFDDFEATVLPEMRRLWPRLQKEEKGLDSFFDGERPSDDLAALRSVFAEWLKRHHLDGYETSDGSIADVRWMRESALATAARILAQEGGRQEPGGPLRRLEIPGIHGITQQIAAENPWAIHGTDSLTLDGPGLRGEKDPLNVREELEELARALGFRGAHELSFARGSRLGSPISDKTKERIEYLSQVARLDFAFKQTGPPVLMGSPWKLDITVEDWQPWMSPQEWIDEVLDLARFRAKLHVERRMIQAEDSGKFSASQEKRNLDHFDWFARHQVAGETIAAISRTPGSCTSRDTVKAGLNRTSEMIGMPRLKPRPGRPRKAENPPRKT